MIDSRNNWRLYYGGEKKKTFHIEKKLPKQLL